MIGEGHWNDECGVFGIVGNDQASTLVYYGLQALQHRGQESAGIVSSSEDGFHSFKRMGRVVEVISKNNEYVLRDSLKGKRAIGHVRYSTEGGSVIENAQPFSFDTGLGPIAIAHNGNLINSVQLRMKLEAEGSIFRSTTDTEVIVHLIARSRAETILERIYDALSQISGAYSLLIMTNEHLYAIRDPMGFRPLVVGAGSGGWYAVSSETCAFDLIDAKYVREVEPGEIAVFSRDGGIERHRFGNVTENKCVFEYVYFSRPDSVIFGNSVYPIRVKFGRQLALESSVDADLVFGLPDSGIPAAIGYAEQSGIPYQMGMIRSHYVGRTFIEPSQNIRELKARLKHNPVREVIQGKRVVVVDDSIVRGTTGQKIINMIREAGAREIHMRISSPPVTHPCYFGIDTPKQDQLVAFKHTKEETRTMLGCDTLEYLSHEGMIGVVKEHGGFCTACFTGKYPIDPTERPDRQMKLFRH